MSAEPKNVAAGESSVPSCGYDLAKLVASQISHIEFSGGLKHGNQLKIFLMGGRVLHVDAEIDVSRYGIRPQISYSIGSWGQMNTLTMLLQEKTNPPSPQSNPPPPKTSP